MCEYVLADKEVGRVLVIVAEELVKTFRSLKETSQPHGNK